MAGWAYVSVILMVWFAAELFLGRFRNEDTMGTWILFTIALATASPVAFQWYLVRGQIRVWFERPCLSLPRLVRPRARLHCHPRLPVDPRDPEQPGRGRRWPRHRAAW